MAVKEPGVLIEMELNEDLPIIKKTLENGNLKVHNVPHVQEDDDIYTIPGHVMYKMTQIFRYMIENNIREFDYDQF
jgi:hypothetical protein